MTQFGKSKDRADGMQPYCKGCRRQQAHKTRKKLAAYHRAYRTLEQHRQWLSSYKERTKDARREVRRRSHLRLKLEVFNHYGGAVCVCCGESYIDFLVIDHVNGGGTKERKAAGLYGISLCRLLRKNNYPAGYRVLCHNCNWGVFLGGGTCRAHNNNHQLDQRKDDR